MHVFIKCSLLLCSCFAATVLAAQSAQVKGIIQGNDSPVAGATVSIGGHTLLSDSAGQFSLSLPVGKYKMNISMVGYTQHQQTLTLAEGKIKELQVSLQQLDSLMGEVVVTGTLKPVQRLQSPIAVEVYSPQFFKKNPSPTVFEALQNINGVRPQINCSVCNTGDIHINGLEGPYTMVTIDGMPIVSSLSTVYGLFGIPSQLIERVEVVKGPASGLYGSEAVGGLINIITKSPEKAPLFSANFMTTSWLEHNLDLGVRFKANKASSLLGINYFNFQKPFDRNNDNFTDVTLQHRISVFNKWNLQRKFNRRASLAARYFYEDRWGGEIGWNRKFRGTDSMYAESIYTNRWELIGNYQLPFQEKMFLSFSATAHKQNSYYGTTPYLADQKIMFGQWTWDKEMGKNHSLLFGAASRFTYYDDNSTATVDTATKQNRPEKIVLPGVFVQDEWRLNDHHTLLLGMRYDYHPVHHSIVTPRLAYKWGISSQQVFRMNLGTGFRVVNLFTEEHAALTGARAVEIREQLKPERSYNINLNYTQQFGSRAYPITVDASVWYSYFDNQIIADYETDPNKIIYDNLKGHAISRGMTLNLELNILQRLKGTLGATLQEVSKRETNEWGQKIKERPMLTESWSGVWALTYTMPLAGLTVDYTGNVYGPMRLPLASNLDPRPAMSGVWSIQNLQLSKYISQQWEVFGGVKNLLNWVPSRNLPFLIARAHDPFDKKVEFDSRGEVLQTPENPYALTFDPSYVYAPNQGRKVFLGVRFTVK